MKIGTVELEHPVALAPMAGMTDTAFRRLVKRMEKRQANDKKRTSVNILTIYARIRTALHVTSHPPAYS